MKDRVVQLFNLTKDKILVDQNIPKNSFESLEKFWLPLDKINQ